MLHTDVSGLDVTCASPKAVDAWNRVVEHFLSHDRATPVALAEALDADVEFVLALCAKGLFASLLARAELTAPAREALARAEASLRLRGGTTRERLYVDALRSATQGRLSSAVAALDAVLEAQPRDSLAAKLAHAMRFMLGDDTGMRASIEQVVARAGLDHPHLGYLLGCLAFALEETGAFRDAERLARRAIERAPRDVWGLHALIHVHEMTGRAAQGAEILAGHAGAFEHCNNFAYHLFWHQALFRLEFGDLDGALRLYDERVRVDKTDDFRDIANATLLLERLELEGANVGLRWEELAAIAERRIADHSLVFASLHYALALVGAGRSDAARQIATSLAEGVAAGDQKRVAKEIGAPAAEALIAFGESLYSEATRKLLAVRPKLRRIGGSNAQRDLFDQLLIDACLRDGASREAAFLVSERLVVRGANHFAAERAAPFGFGSYAVEPLSI